MNKSANNSSNSNWLTHFCNRELIAINKDSYLNLLIIIAPLLNFLSGTCIDLSAPSLPAIAQYFQTSQALAQNTIAATMIGSACGCIIFGNFIDIIGRCATLLCGLSIFTLTSILAPFSANISQLIGLRFFQGIALAVVSITP